jgi:hypothetical protein
MKFLNPMSKSNEYISSKIQFITNDSYHKVMAVDNIKEGEIILIEYPKINLFGEEEVDKGLQLTKKYIELNESELYPRNINDFVKTKLIKNVHKIIKNSDKKLQNFFEKYTKKEIEFYYAKYIFNAFEGWNYGPLTLPLTAKFNHSCDSNIIFNFNKTTGSMIVKTTKFIKKGSELFDSYLINKDISKEAHKEYLFDHYGFYCNCK